MVLLAPRCAIRSYSRYLFVARERIILWRLVYSFKEILLVLGSKGKLGPSHIFARALLNLFRSSWSSSNSPSIYTSRSSSTIMLCNMMQDIMMESKFSRLHPLAGSLMIFHHACRILKALLTSFWYASWCKVNNFSTSFLGFGIAWISVAHFG